MSPVAIPRPFVRPLLWLCAVAVVAAASAPAAAGQIRGERFTVRYWPVDPADPVFPEHDDPELEYLWERPSFGIAFSGGGTRSASAVWGQLRGLDRLGWLDQARYLSSVSGGAWSVIPYTYLANGCGAEDPWFGDDFFPCVDYASQDDLDRWFLDEYIEPGDLRDRDLAKDTDSYVEALSRTQILRLYLLRLPIRGDETYSRALGKRFLHAVGQYDCHQDVDGCPRPDKHDYFVAHPRQSQDIIESSRRTLDGEDFVYMAPRRPFSIAGATILGKKRGKLDDLDLFPFEMTPLYVGFPSRIVSRRGQEFGGGYVEPPAWDGEGYEFFRRAARAAEVAAAAGEEPPRVEVRKRQPLRTGLHLRYRMSLSDVLGGTGAAPAKVLRRFGFTWLGLPEWDSPELGVSVSPAPEFAIGDGGFLENTGLVPLLARRVEHILVFVNTARPFRVIEEAPETCLRARRTTNLHEVFMDCWYPGTDPADPGELQPLLRLASEPPAAEETTPSDGSRAADWPPPGLADVQASFPELRREGRPLVHCDRYRTVANPRLAIPEYTPRICFVVLDRAQDWVEQVDPATQLGRQLARGKLRFWQTYQGFPHYGTFFHRWFRLRVIDLDARQVNALAHLTAWTVVESADQIREGLGLDLPRADAARRERPEREVRVERPLAR